MFDLARISASGLVARIDYHESIGSTNDRALALAAEEAADLPLLVLARWQTAGRGRGTNRWWMGEGGLAFSLLLEAPPDRLPAARWPQVSLATGLAVCDALQELLPSADIRVKWPNDVYLSGRKVCGILCESAQGWRDRLVVGVGMNVNNRIQSPKSKVQSPMLDAHHDGGTWTLDVGSAHDLTSTATSLIDHDGLARDLTGVLLGVLDQFDRRWHELLTDQFQAALAPYRRRCFLTGKSLIIRGPGGQSVSGVCAGIDDAGALTIHTADGPQTVLSGTVHLDDDRALL